MGNNQISYSSSQIQDWNPSQKILQHYPGKPRISYLKCPNIYNQYVGLQFIVESSSGDNEIKQMKLYELRQSKLHPNVMGVYSVTKGKSLYKFGTTEVQATNCLFKVITQYLQIRLSDISSLNFQQSLELLKGITLGTYQLYKQIGGFIITSDMIGIDSKGNVKVWFHSNFAKNIPQFKTIEEIEQKKMCLQLYKIMSKFISQNRSFPPQLLQSIIQTSKLQKLLLLLKRATDCQINKELMLQLVLKEKTFQTLNKKNNQKYNQKHSQNLISKRSRKQNSYYIPHSYHNNENYVKHSNYPIQKIPENERYRLTKSKTLIGLSNGSAHQQQKEFNKSKQFKKKDTLRKGFVNSPVIEKRKNISYNPQYAKNISQAKQINKNSKNLSSHTPYSSDLCQKSDQRPFLQKNKTFRPSINHNMFYSPQNHIRTQKKQQTYPSGFFNNKNQSHQIFFQKQNLRKNRASNTQLMQNDKDSQIGRYTIDNSNATNLEKSNEKIHSNINTKISSNKSLLSIQNVKSTFCDDSKTKKLIQSNNSSSNKVAQITKNSRKRVRFNEEEFPTLVSIQSQQSIVIATGKSLKLTNNKSNHEIFNPFQKPNNFKSIQKLTQQPWSKEKNDKTYCTPSNLRSNQDRKTSRNQFSEIQQKRRKRSIQNYLEKSSLVQNESQFGVQKDEYLQRSLTQIQKQYMKKFINEENLQNNISLNNIAQILWTDNDEINQLTQSGIKLPQQLSSKQSGQTIIDKLNTKRNENFVCLFSQQIPYKQDKNELSKDRISKKMCFLKEKNYEPKSTKKLNFSKNYKHQTHQFPEKEEQNQTKYNVNKFHFPLSLIANMKDQNSKKNNCIQRENNENNLEDLILNFSRSKNQQTDFLHTINQTQRDRQYSSQFDQISEGQSFAKKQNSRGSF